MIIRMLFLLLSFLVLVNLLIITMSYILNVNIYQKYGKQLLIIFGSFVLVIAAMFVTAALIGLV
ncbi:hypothetical protein IKB17_04645 [bacterium]|nr:hypothetical protein [bacterium]